jgi:hypothetical protein
LLINGGLQHCIGKEVSPFEQGKDDLIENIDDICIHYDGGRVAANEALISAPKDSLVEPDVLQNTSIQEALTVAQKNWRDYHDVFEHGDEIASNPLLASSDRFAHQSDL